MSNNINRRNLLKAGIFMAGGLPLASSFLMNCLQAPSIVVLQTRFYLMRSLNLPLLLH